MRKVEFKKAFLRDIDRHKRSDLWEEIDSILYYLERERDLPESYRAHPLFWQWRGFWDVHLDGDLILIYKLTPKRIFLWRILKHSELREGKPWKRGKYPGQ